MNQRPELTSPLLDGRADLTSDSLAHLAYQRAALGAGWLSGVLRTDGAFFYEYDPVSDSYEKASYNQVRHAGTTYALWQFYGATRSAVESDQRILDAAEAATEWIAAHSMDLGARGHVYCYRRRMKLGGQALALVALLERRRVTADMSRDSLIAGLAAFMCGMELPKNRGRYHQSWDAKTDELLLTPTSDYYPGEALLALTRLAEQSFQDGPWLAAAQRAAQYLVHVKDGDIPTAGKVPRQNHWLTMALAELYRLHRDVAYRTVAYLQADDMLASQFGVDSAYAETIGADKRKLINYTSTATKGEAMVAAWAMAKEIGDQEADERFASGARRNAQFCMRVQWVKGNCGLFPQPERLHGAWGESPGRPRVRIDFVQHNISTLMGVWYMTRHGDLPTAAGWLCPP